MAELLSQCVLTLALGSLLSLPFISVREIGRGFFTLWVAVVGALGLLGLVLRRSIVGGALWIDGCATLLALSLGLLVVFWIVLRVGYSRLATAALFASALCGGFALREMAMTSWVSAHVPPTMSGAALRVSSLLLSALAVGMVTVAMVLGHWYLVQPKLAVAPLRRCCDVLLGILLARLIVSGWGVAASSYSILGRDEPIPWEALILTQRLLFGFGGALVLAVMIRKTVALRSTMSATGLLYIAILFVWVGEFLSLYLGRLTGGSLVV